MMSKHINQVSVFKVFRAQSFLACFLSNIVNIMVQAKTPHWKSNQEIIKVKGIWTVWCHMFVYYMSLSVPSSLGSYTWYWISFLKPSIIKQRSTQNILHAIAMVPIKALSMNRKKDISSCTTGTSWEKRILRLFFKNNINPNIWKLAGCSPLTRSNFLTTKNIPLSSFSWTTVISLNKKPKWKQILWIKKTLFFDPICVWLIH